MSVWRSHDECMTIVFLVWQILAADTRRQLRLGTTYVSMASRGRGRGGKDICQVEKPHCTVIGRGSLYIRYHTCNPIILYIFTSLLKGDLIAELDNCKKKKTLRSSLDLKLGFLNPVRCSYQLSHQSSCSGAEGRWYISIDTVQLTGWIFFWLTWLAMDKYHLLSVPIPEFQWLSW